MCSPRRARAVRAAAVFMFSSVEDSDEVGVLLSHEADSHPEPYLEHGDSLMRQPKVPTPEPCHQFPLQGLPEDQAKKHLREVIVAKRQEQAMKRSLLHCLSGALPWDQEVHRSTVALHRKDEVVEQLTQLVAALHEAGEEEKARHLALQHEYEGLQEHIKEQHERLAMELQGVPLVTQEVSFHRQSRPEKLTRHPVVGTRPSKPCGLVRLSRQRGRRALDAPREEKENSSGLANASELSCRTRCAAKQPLQAPKDRPKVICSMAASQTLRTVWLPNEHADLLVLTMEHLTTQLEEQSQMRDRKAGMLIEIRRTRQAEHRRRVKAQEDTIKQLEGRLPEVQEQAREKSRDLQALHEGLQRQEEEMEVERLLQVKELIAAANMRDAVLADLKQSQEVSKERYASFKHIMNKESATREQQFRGVRHRYAELQDLYKKKIEGLEQEFLSECTRLHSLQQQRKFVLTDLPDRLGRLRAEVQLLQIAARGCLMFDSVDPLLSLSLHGHDMSKADGDGNKAMSQTWGRREVLIT